MSRKERSLSIKLRDCYHPEEGISVVMESQWGIYTNIKAYGKYDIPLIKADAGNFFKRDIEKHNIVFDKHVTPEVRKSVLDAFGYKPTVQRKP